MERIKIIKDTEVYFKCNSNLSSINYERQLYSNVFERIKWYIEKTLNRKLEDFDIEKTINENDNKIELTLTIYEK